MQISHLLPAPLKLSSSVQVKVMSYRILGQIIENAILPANQKFVLIVLANFHNDELQKAWPSQETLCRVTSLSRRTINRALRELEKKGHITTSKERTSGQYPHSIYRINHVSERHMVEKVGAKNDLTMCQKKPSPCATAAHYPLRNLKNTLNNNDDNKRFKKSSKKTLSEKQLNFARNLAAKYYKRFKEEYYSFDLILGDIEAYLLTSQRDQDWRKLGNGLPPPSTFK